MLIVDGIRLGPGAPQDEAQAQARKRLGLGANTPADCHIHRVSVDGRHRQVSLVYAVAVRLDDEALEARFVKKPVPGVRRIAYNAVEPVPGGEKLPGPVVVCGLGPAGLFCALRLAKAGFRPVVLERGPAMDERRAAVEGFEQTGVLDENANIQFGEGGAGTFSDGKLATRINDPLCHQVTQALLSAGAPPEIAWMAKPHIGTDKLRDVFVALRQQLRQLGGQVRFNTRLTGLQARGGRIDAVRADGGDIPCGVLVLATGHSARDTFGTLRETGITLLSKPFSVGLRIEHLQRTIDEGLYHGLAGHPALPPGEYQLSCKTGGRGVYTFCMCPGGSVVAAASQAGGVVTNGMSDHARSGPNANAALVAGVGPEDFGGDPFRAIAFQRELEQAAYKAGGGGYAAPAETLGSFMQGGGALKLGKVQPSYPRGVAAASLGALFPGDIADALRAGAAAFGRKLPGFDDPDAVLTGVETRTSSPVRLPRGEAFESAELPGLYPCGEGAGYAGGIMSAAVDGLHVAHAIIERYSPENS